MSAATPGAGTAKKLMTADEFWEFVHRPENQDRDFELIRGEVVERMRPYRKHGAVCALVCAQLVAFALRTERGYAVTALPGLVLPGKPQSVVCPDVVYFADTPTGVQEARWWSHLPALVVEVLAPNEDSGLMTVKVEAYSRSGVPAIWLVDYEKKHVAVCKPARDPVVFGEQDELVEDGPLTGLTVPVTDLFRLPAERTRPLWPGVA